METLVSTSPFQVRWRVVLGAEKLSFPTFRGCVSGKQLENLREEIRKDDSYDFDMIDGYDEIK